MQSSGKKIIKKKKKKKKKKKNPAIKKLEMNRPKRGKAPIKKSSNQKFNTLRKRL